MSNWLKAAREARERAILVEMLQQQGVQTSRAEEVADALEEINLGVFLCTVTEAKKLLSRSHTTVLRKVSEGRLRDIESSDENGFQTLIWMPSLLAEKELMQSKAARIAGKDAETVR